MPSLATKAIPHSPPALWVVMNLQFASRIKRAHHKLRKPLSCMVRHLHHVPGRLRVRLASLKRNAPEAAPLHAELLSIQGVNSVSVNSITGSVIIQYNRNCFDPKVVWTTLQRLGYVHQAPKRDLVLAEGANNSTPSDLRDLKRVAANAVLKTLLGAVVEQCLGRAAGILIGRLT